MLISYRLLKFGSVKDRTANQRRKIVCDLARKCKYKYYRFSHQIVLRICTVTYIRIEVILNFKDLNSS